MADMADKESGAASAAPVRGTCDFCGSTDMEIEPDRPLCVDVHACLTWIRMAQGEEPFDLDRWPPRKREE